MTLRFRRLRSYRTLALASALVGPAAQAQTRAIVVGRIVTDSTEQPVPDVRISLGSTAVISAQSDSSGRYRIDNLQPGQYSVLVRRLGFAPVATSITLAAGDSVEADFVLKPLAQELPSVDVSTTVPNLKLRDFEDRRRFGIGYFMTEADIRKAPGSRLSEKVRQFPGLQILYSPSSSIDVRVATTRGGQSVMRSGPCLSAIMLDGQTLVQPFSVNSLDPADIIAMEWYAGPASMPAQFNATRNSCGLLAIWTR